MTASLRHYGVPFITEELVLLMWITLPFLASFTEARLRVVCNDMRTGYATLQYLSAGLDFAGVELLSLERRIGEKL